MRSIKQNAIKIARAGIIALTFILAFAIVFAAPIESSTDVALAVDATGGAAKAIYGAKGELTADNFGSGFPGTGNNTTTWTHTEYFSGVTLDSSNISACLNKTTQPLRLDAAGTNGFRFGMNAHESRWDTDGWKACAVLNYQISPFLKSMISNTVATVQVTSVSAVLERVHGNSLKMKAVVNASAASAATYIDDAETGYQTATGTSATLKQSSVITLAASDNVVSIVFYAGGGAGGTSGEYYGTGYAHDISVSFKITLKQEEYSGTVLDDGAAPILQSIDSKAPFRTNNSSDWNYNPSKDITTSITNEIKNIYNQNLDRVDANNNVYLHSYVNPQTDGQVIDGKTYYKTVTETFVDQYSYGSSTVKVADAVGKQYYGGIKKVEVAGASFGLWDIVTHGTTAVTNKHTSFQTLTVDGVQVGWARVYVIHRSKVQVELYFKDNADVTITVSDYGDKQVAKTVSVKGIDSQTNSEMESILKEYESYFMESKDFVDSGSWADIKWFYSSEIAFEFDSVKDSNGNEIERDVNNSPYMWFYSVVKAGSIGSTLTSANWQLADMMANKVPFAVDNLSFKYDFKTGLANGETPGQNGSSATGSGYYLFTFYKVALSGKYDEATAVRSYYVKVDYDTPVYTLNKASGGVDLANTDWAAGAPLVITLTQEEVSLAGNTLTFTTIDGNDNEVTQKIYLQNGLIYTVDDRGNKSEMASEIKLHDGGSTVYVDYSNGVWTITFAKEVEYSEQGRDTYKNSNYITTFELTTGVEVEIDSENEPATYVDSNWQYQQAGRYFNGVYILIDRNAPLAPNFMNSDDLEEEYIVEMDELYIPAIDERIWYTSSWTYPGQFDFSDELVGDYGNQIKVYYAIAHITNASDFENTGNEKLSIARFLEDYNGAGYGHLSLYNFVDYQEYSANKLDELTTLNVALNSKLGAGMRVLLFWTVDQAGNKSEMHMYHILADANNYYVTGRIDNGIFEYQKDVTILSGGAKTAYKRGDVAEIEYAIDYDSPYVPYKYSIDRGGEGIELIHETTNPTSLDVTFDSDTVSIDSTMVSLIIDDSSLGALQTKTGGSLDFYFSFRELIDITFDSNAVYYTSTNIVLPFEVSNEDARALIEYGFEGFEMYETPVNAGEYLLSMSLETESYVAVGLDSWDFYINPAPITISINGETSIYGDNQSFSYTVDGLVGKELEAWDPTTYTFSIAGLALPTADQWILYDGQAVTSVNIPTMNVGTYTLSFDTSVSDGTISDNYVVTELVWAEHIINQREIVASVVSTGKTFGDNDAQINFTIDTASLLPGVNGANITDILNNAVVVSANASTITMTGADLISRNAGENVGEYGFSADTSAFAVDGNYKLILDVAGKTFTIAQRELVVTAVNGEKVYGDADGQDKFTVEKSALLSGVVITDIITNAEIVSENATTITMAGADLISRNAGENVGTYSYTADTSAFAVDGNYKLVLKVAGKAFTITQRELVVTAVNGGKVYGEEDGQDRFTVEKSALLAGAVVTDIITNAEIVSENATTITMAGADLISRNAGENVGTYSYTADTSAFAVNGNYKLVLNVAGKTFTITQRELVITALNGGKVYGEEDGQISFAVLKSSLAHGASITDIIRNAEVLSEDATSIIMTGEGLITRASGEKVGSYKYNSSVSNFDINENYSLVIDLAGKTFVIEKKIVLVTIVSGQEFEYGGEDNYAIEYTLSDTSFAYALVTPVWVLTDVDVEEVGLRKYISKAVSASLASSDANIGFELASGAIITVIDIADGHTIYITKNDVLGKIYDGTSTLGAVVITDSDNNGYTCIASDGEALPSNFRIEFTPKLTATTVGTYTVKVTASDISLYVDGVDKRDEYLIILSDITVVISPATIEVSRDSVITKTYDGTSALDRVALTSAVAGGYGVSFVDGTIPSNYRIEFTPVIGGASVDSYTATFADVKVYGGSDDLSGQFNVVFAPCTATITPETIVVAPTFATTSKVYGDSDSAYGIGFEVVDNKGFDSVNFMSFITGSFARNGASNGVGQYGVRVGNEFKSSNNNFVVEVADLAGYTLTISAKAISFADIDKSSLYGNDKVYDGTTAVVFADGEKANIFDISSQLAYGDDQVSIDFTAIFTDATIGAGKTIQYSQFILAGADKENYVLINAEDVVLDVVVNKDGKSIKIAEFGLYIDLAHFTIAKVYDGTTAVAISNITIDSDSLLSGFDFTAVAEFASKNAGVYSTDMVLTFTELTEDRLIVAENAKEYVSFENGCLVVSLSGIASEIAPKTINAQDFVDADAVDRIYNGKTAVDMTFRFTDGVVVDGDTLADVGVTLNAVADSKNAGTRAVVIEGFAIANSNYVAGFNADELTAYINADVEIQRAVVELNVIYDSNKVYNGRSNSTLVNGTDVRMGAGDVFRLVSDIDMDSNVWAEEIGTITVDFDSIVFTYTVNGEANGSVAYDGNGNVVNHDVRVSGLALTATNPDILSNYEIGGEHIAEPMVLASEMEFECIAVAPMAKRIIVQSNPITVHDKMYDGTRTAQVTARITEEMGIVAEDASLIEFIIDANFKTANIGTQKVTVSINGLKNAGEEDVASNYELSSKWIWDAEQTISPAPMVVSATIGAKTYDGTTKVNVEDIIFDLAGKRASDGERYAVNVLAGLYEDANVYDQNGNVASVKLATLYGVELRNSITGVSNYYPVFASATEIDGLTEITDLGGITPVSGMHYYALPTENIYQLTEEEFNQIKDTVDMSYYIDKYTVSRKTYYLFKEGANIQGKEAITVSILENAEGKINPRAIKIRVDVLNPDAFTKTYDGTAIFTGVAGTDFVITGGFMANDGEYITISYNALFSSSEAGNVEVVFTFSDNALAGKDGSLAYLNYTAEGTTYSVKGATIKKTEIKAILDAITAIYGDDASTYQVNIRYFIGDKEVVIEGNKGYILDGNNKIELEGTFTAPTMVTSAMSLTSAGVHKATLSGGYATNYEFSYGYSKMVDGESVYDEALEASELVIEKKVLTVSAVQGNGEYSYQAMYLETLPTAVLSYYGFVGNDGSNKVTALEGAVTFKLFNGTEYVDMPADAVPSSELEDGQYYVAIIDTAKLSASNYVFEAIGTAKLEIIMADFAGISIQDTTVTHNGQSQMGNVTIIGDMTDVTVDYKYYIGSVAEENLVTEVKDAGEYIVVATFTKTIGSYTQSATFQSTLTIERSDISVSIDTTRYDYQDKDLSSAIRNEIKGNLKGVLAEDVATVASALMFKFYKVLPNGDENLVTKVEDAGDYKVEVIFTSADGALGNYNDYTATFKFKVLPATIIVDVHPDLDVNSIVVEIDENGNIVLPETLSIVFKYDFAQSYKDKYGVDAGDIEEKRFAIQFSDRPSKLITAPGYYSFTIVYLSSGSSDVEKYDGCYISVAVETGEKPSTKINENYVLIGTYNGTLSVKTRTVRTEDVVLEFVTGDPIISSSLKITSEEITEFVESDALYDYWLAIDKFTPHVNYALYEAGTDYVADLEVIMQIRLMNGKTIVQPGREVQLTVNFLLEYAIEEYKFYMVGADGLLHEIESYTIDDNGALVFTTTHIDSIVAYHLTVDESAGQLPDWFWYVVGGGAGLIVIIIVVVCSVVGAKKKKAKGNPDGTDPSEDKEKKDDNKPEKKAEKKAKEKPEKQVKEKAEKKPEPQPEKKAEPKAEQKAEPAKAEKKPEPKVEKKAEPAKAAPAPAPQAPAQKPVATPAPQQAPVAPKAAPAPQAPQRPMTPPVVGVNPQAPQRPVGAPQQMAPPRPMGAPAGAVPPRPASAPQPQQAPVRPMTPPVVGANPQAPQRPMGAPQQAPVRPVAPTPQKPATPPVVGTKKPPTPPVVGKK